MRIDELEAEGIYQRGALFFPVITYPPPLGLPSWTEEEMFADRGAYDANAVALYVHVPFCIARCVYCHWVVFTGSDEDRVQRYFEALERELAAVRERLGGGLLQPRSILIGGGTPTYPVPRQFEAFFQLLRRHIDFSRCAQFTVEAEPTTLLGTDGTERLAVMRDYGVDRVSMGVQSFDDATLKSLGRVHGGRQVLEAIQRLRDSGMSSISIDLIYGLPTQTLETWADTMHAAVASGADAWQLYQLRVLPHGDKPGKIIDQYKKNRDRFPNLDDVLVMKMIGQIASEEGGFPQQYTRIFARSPEHISYYLHDVNHKLFNVLGFGISSWSNIGRIFTQNVGNDFERYYAQIDAGHLPVDRGMRRSDDDEMRRAVILPLKNTLVEVQKFRQRFGISLEDSPLGPGLARLQTLGLLETEGDCLQMSERGRFFADEALITLFPDAYRPKRELTHAVADDE